MDILLNKDAMIEYGLSLPEHKKYYEDDESHFRLIDTLYKNIFWFHVDIINNIPKGS